MRFGLFTFFFSNPDADFEDDSDVDGDASIQRAFVISPDGLSRVAESMREKLGDPSLSDEQALNEFDMGPANDFRGEAELRYGVHDGSPFVLEGAYANGFDTYEVEPDRIEPLMEEWRALYETWAGPGSVGPSEEISAESDFDIESWASARAASLWPSSESA